MTNLEVAVEFSKRSAAAPVGSSTAPDAPRISKRASRLLSGGLVTIACVWVAGLWTTNLEFGPYGILPSLSPLLYMSSLVAFGGLTFAVTRGLHGHAAGYALLLALFVALPPFVLEQTIRFPYVFDSFRYADALAQSGKIDYAQSYLAWPGWHIVSFATMEAARWPLPSFAQWSSLVLAVVSAAAGVMLLLRMTGRGRLFWMALVASAPFVGGLSYPLPGTMAGILWIFTLVLVADEYLSPATPYVGRRLLVMLLICGIVVTHLLTTIAMIASLILVPAAAWLLGKWPHRMALGLLSASVMLVFLFYLAIATTAQLLPIQINAILKLEELFSSTVGTTGRAIFGGSDAHTTVALIRIGYVIVASALGGLALLVGLLRHRTGEPSWWFPGALIGTGLSTLTIGPYGGEIVVRAYTFAAPGLPPLVATLLNRVSAWVLIPLLALGVLFAPVNAYGNELSDHVYAQELAADRFVETYGPVRYRLEGASRTLIANWMPGPQTGPVVSVTGRLYGDILRFLRSGVSTYEARFWQYDNGGVQVSISAEP